MAGYGLSQFAYKYPFEGLVFTQPVVIYRKQEVRSLCLLVYCVCDILWYVGPSRFTHNIPMYQEAKKGGLGSVDRTTRPGLGNSFMSEFITTTKVKLNDELIKFNYQHQIFRWW